MNGFFTNRNLRKAPVAIVSVYSLGQWSLLREVSARLSNSGYLIQVVYHGASRTVALTIKSESEKFRAGLFDFETLTSERLVFSEQVERAIAQEPLRHPFAVTRLLYRRLIARVMRKLWPWTAEVEGPRRLFDAANFVANKILHEFDPAVLIVAEDGVGANLALIQVAKKRGVPVIDVPFGVGASEDYDNFIEDKYRTGDLNFVPDNELGRQVRRRCPSWIRETKYGDVTISPPHVVLARVMAGHDVEKPWVVHGGRADVLVVESDAMLRHYRAEGISESKLRLGGSVYADVLFEELTRLPNKKIQGRTRSHGSRTSMLVSLPPSYHDSRGHLCEFKDYSELLKELLAFFKSLPNLDITFSIHPGTQPAERALYEQFGANISDEWLVRLIPRHDIFFTTFSSTIRWAILCGVPVVNYDVYSFRLNTYTETPGVFTSTRAGVIKEHLRQLVLNESYLESWTSKLVATAPSWGTLDGRNFERLLAIIERQSQANRT